MTTSGESNQELPAALELAATSLVLAGPPVGLPIRAEDIDYVPLRATTPGSTLATRPRPEIAVPARQPFSTDEERMMDLLRNYSLADPQARKELPIFSSLADAFGVSNSSALASRPAGFPALEHQPAILSLRRGISAAGILAMRTPVEAPGSDLAVSQSPNVPPPFQEGDPILVRASDAREGRNDVVVNPSISYVLQEALLAVTDPNAQQNLARHISSRIWRIGYAQDVLPQDPGNQPLPLPVENILTIIGKYFRSASDSENLTRTIELLRSQVELLHGIAATRSIKSDEFFNGFGKEKDIPEDDTVYGTTGAEGHPYALEIQRLQREIDVFSGMRDEAVRAGDRGRVENLDQTLANQHTRLRHLLQGT
ncbi:MAG TPA: hypothetical protein VJ836_02995 [Candidatus Saccharimonadales bacterium]|nr:hypothetical protein [Candidatus Saccharimonadales bacterium]